jgi:hypothetical protein
VAGTTPRHRRFFVFFLEQRFLLVLIEGGRHAFELEGGAR